MDDLTPEPDEQHPEVAHAPEALSRALVVPVIFGTISFSIALCFVAYVLLRGREAELHATHASDRNLAAPYEVADIKQTLFRPARPAPSLIDRERRELDAYRWVDRRQRVVRIPITQAMDLIVARDREGKAP
jgi:hypothetical protein